ncbi:MAG TPA: OB-fold domain-containing protein, partial [Pseudomonadales bacterium]|nr:OB-fold domain-containing protein [Pseudomonadales bacterium]
KPGDTVIAHTKIHSISEEKATGMGTGYFIETRTEFTDQNKELVGTMLFRVLKFKPAQAAKPVAENAQEENKAPTRAKSVRGHDNAWWWEQLEKNKVVTIQRCKSCSTLRHPPRPFCNQCQSGEWDFVTSKLDGEIFSFVELHYPEIPGYTYPLMCAVITLDEGTRILSNIIDCKPEDVQIGKRVKGEVMQVDADNVLPQFRLV